MCLNLMDGICRLSSYCLRARAGSSRSGYLLFALSTIGLPDLEAPTEGSRSAPEDGGARMPWMVGLCRLEEAKMLRLTQCTLRGLEYWASHGLAGWNAKLVEGLSRKPVNG